MNYKSLWAIIALAAVALGLPLTSLAAADTSKVDLIMDRSAGGVEAIDFDGPTGYGFVNYNQDANGNMTVVVSLKNAEPDTTYEGVFWVCGPTHATACGFVDVGEISTNARGNGNAVLHLAVETLQSSPFGSGSRTDHFDILGPEGDVYAATGINYLVP